MVKFVKATQSFRRDEQEDVRTVVYKDGKSRKVSFSEDISDIINHPSYLTTLDYDASEADIREILLEYQDCTTIHMED